MNVLLTSVGRRSYLVRYFKEALHGNGEVVATNSIPNAPGMWAADRSFVVPPAGAPGFIDRILDVCRENRVRLLCSLHDWEAPFIADAGDRFRHIGVIPVVSSRAVLDTCLDKFATYQFGMRENIRVPRTALGIVEARRQIANGELAFPLVVKPRWGQGSICIETVCDLEELQSACLLSQRKLARMESNGLLGTHCEETLIVQEQIGGVEYGLDVVHDLQGCFAACFVKRKLGMRAGETDAAETVASPELGQLGRLIGDRLGHIGMLDVDVLMDERGPCLLEMNPRFGGHYPFSHVAGANVPAALIAWANGKHPDKDWLHVVPGVRAFKDIALVKS